MTRGLSFKELNKFREQYLSSNSSDELSMEDVQITVLEEVVREHPQQAFVDLFADQLVDQENHEDICADGSVSELVSSSNLFVNASPSLSAKDEGKSSAKAAHNMYMVVYSPQMRLADFFEAIRLFILVIEDKGVSSSTQQQVTFWIDIFCVPLLLKASDAAQQFVQQVELATKLCGDQVLLLSPWKYGEDIFSRALSQYQLFMATESDQLWRVSMTTDEIWQFQQALSANSDEVKQLLTKYVQLTSHHPLQEVKDVDVAVSNSFPPSSHVLQLLSFLESEAFLSHFLYTIHYGIKRWLWSCLKRQWSLPNVSSPRFKPDRKSKQNLFAADSNDLFELKTVEDPHPLIDADMDKLECFLVACIEEESELLQKAGESKGECYCADASHLIFFLQELYTVYCKQHRFEEAEHVLLKVLELQKHELGAINLETLQTTLKMADLFVLSHKYSMAELFFVSYIKGLKECGRSSGRDILLACQHVGNFFYTQRSYDKAEKMYMSCFELAIDLHGRIHHVSLHAASMLANIYVQQWRYEKAKEFGKTCVEIAEALHDENHPLPVLFRGHYKHMLSLRYDEPANPSEAFIESFPVLEVNELLDVLQVHVGLDRLNSNSEESSRSQASQPLRINNDSSKSCIIC